MKSTEGTEALVALEDAAPDVLFESIPGTDIRVWPLFRWLVARSTAESELRKFAVGRRGSRASKVVRAARSIAPNRFASSQMRNQSDALFIVNGGTFSQTPTGRENWLVGDHARALGARSVILQDLPVDNFTPRLERPAFQPTFTFEDEIIRVEADARRSTHTEADRALAGRIADAVYDGLDFEVDAAQIERAKTQLFARLARARFSAARFSRILDRVQPKVTFVQTGSYGDRSHLIALMKERGVFVAEHQHGWIGPSHGAYNYGEAMRSGEMKARLPDALLTFGDFWSSAVRFPGQTVAIGKPHLELVAGQQAGAADRKSVMVISGVYERDEMTRFTLEIRDLLPADWRVLYRPHPSERDTVELLYPGLVGQERVQFDREPDVYTSLAGAGAVFGLASTVLYEALAFGCAVIVKDSPLADLYIEDGLFGPPISDARGLKSAIDGVVAGAPSGEAHARLERIWKPDAVQNFVAFYDDLPQRSH